MGIQKKGLAKYGHVCTHINTYLQQSDEGIDGVVGEKHMIVHILWGKWYVRRASPQFQNLSNFSRNLQQNEKRVLASQPPPL